MSKREGHPDKKIILLVSGILVLVFTVLFILNFDKKDSRELKVGFIITGEINEFGWNGMHYKGIAQACEEQNAVLLVKENVLEGTGGCVEAVEELIKEGAELIILTSFAYVGEAKDVMAANPEIKFYGNDYNIEADNLTSYFARIYQARYLSGIVAGMTTKTNRIGYVAAMPTSEVNRGINAFTLGAQSVNPAVKVYVTYTGEWDNAEKEKSVTQDLIRDKQIDLVTYHQNRANVIDAAEEAGIYSIGYHLKKENTSDKYLTVVACDWAMTYQEVLRQYQQDVKAHGNITWIGLEKGVVGLTDYSASVSEEAKSAVEQAKQEIIYGKDVFSGLIYDNEGNVRCQKDEMISDDEIMKHMDWLVDGVELYEKNEY